MKSAYDNEDLEPRERWGRWLWRDTGAGRWHALASWGFANSRDTGETLPAVTTACGSIRTLPIGLTNDPDAPICEVCRNLDILRQRRLYEAQPADVPVAEAVRVERSR